MTRSNRLERYKSKRDFSKTPEPKGPSTDPREKRLARRNPVSSEPHSVVSGKTIKEMAKATENEQREG